MTRFQAHPIGSSWPLDGCNHLLVRNKKQKTGKKIKLKICPGSGGADHYGLAPQISFPTETPGLGHGSLPGQPMAPRPLLQFEAG